FFASGGNRGAPRVEGANRIVTAETLTAHREVRIRCKRMMSTSPRPWRALRSDPRFARIRVRRRRIGFGFFATIDPVITRGLIQVWRGLFASENASDGAHDAAHGKLAIIAGEEDLAGFAASEIPALEHAQVLCGLGARGAARGRNGCQSFSHASFHRNVPGRRGALG